MSSEKYHNRLEDLFSEPEPPSSGQSSHDQTLPGWTWECDFQGHFIACSPEIEQVLGFRQDSIIGQPLSNFALTPESASTLWTALNKGDFPINQDVHYQTRDGALIPICLHIFDISHGDRVRWGGFAQAQFFPNTGAFPDEAELIETRVSGADAWKPNWLQPSRVSKDLQLRLKEEDKYNGRDQAVAQSDVEARARRIPIQKPDHILAGEAVMEILDDIRNKSNEVNQYQFSQVTTNKKEELREDRSKKPRITGRLGGAEIRSYPKIVFQEIEYRLEWGNKLDLTADEEDFVKQFKYKPSGLSGLIKTRLAPKEIINADKYWIAVCIEIAGGKSKRIWVSCDRQEEGLERLNWHAFIQDPKILLPQLTAALKSPWKSLSALRIGEDYLIPR